MVLNGGYEVTTSYFLDFAVLFCILSFCIFFFFFNSLSPPNCIYRILYIDEYKNTFIYFLFFFLSFYILYTSSNALLSMKVSKLSLSTL